MRDTSGWFWLWCICHQMHLAVEAGWSAIGEQAPFIKKVKEFVRFMHQSNKQWEALKVCQAEVLSDTTT